ncbi:MAG: hypothetical protein SGILL_001020 [Bacillariaceae sp.]
MAIIRRLNMLPFAPNSRHTRNMPQAARKRKHFQVAASSQPPPSVETSASSSDEEAEDDDYSSESSSSSSSSSSTGMLRLPTKTPRSAVVSPTPQVHFDLDPEDSYDDDENDACCPEPAADLDYIQEHKSDLWYSKADRQSFQSDACEIIQRFKSEQPEAASKFGALYSGKTAANDDDNTTTPQTTAVQSSIELPLLMRGLEWGITPALKKKRQSHIRQVLLACDIANETRRERVIAARSRKSSRIARSVSQQVASDVVFVSEDEEDGVYQEAEHVTESGESTSRPTVADGLPPREPPAKRMRLWQR